MARLMIIDDDPVFSRYVAEIATQAGWTVRTCDDSRTAVATALDYQPELVFSDMIMPECDGLECLQKLAEAMPEIQAVAVTAFDPIYLKMAHRLLKGRFESPLQTAVKPLDPAAIRTLLAASGPRAVQAAAC